ncbi:hypothetical protein GO755_07835 [Spirosoma sp. HMF4905]|uniref:Lipoprotein n=1 Tax=Spirosoma arboris TaxID=2682092 RepID=A0A7K1S8H2_9BACT|nr:hypothetical protein [Spirosoma arboris]MVM29938.1 hypothetical protein [Spirosoma arboris]
MKQGIKYNKMRTTSSLFAVMILLVAACTKSQDDQVTSTFDVSVQGIGGDCKLPLLDFGSRTAEVGKLIGLTSPNTLYYAINLDSIYSKAGTSLQVTIRKVTASEERACTTMGPSYPSVAVTSTLTK